MDRTLVLSITKDSYYFDRIDNSEYTVKSVFRKCDGIEKLVLRFLRKVKLPLTALFYESWYKNIAQYSKIIVLDATFGIDSNLMQNISKKAPKCKKFFYSWNIVRNENLYRNERAMADKYGFAFYCYDHGNCEKYDLNFNTIMYDKTFRQEEKEINCDTLFLGYMKDRKEKMLALYNIMTDSGIKPRFVVACEPKENRLPCFEYSDHYISYYDYLAMLGASRSVLDIAQNGQDGYSMRVMESIYFDKKLITTNSYIINADFYDPNNTLVIDLNNLDKQSIKSFFDKEFHPYSAEVKDYYSFEKWVERFE